MNALQKKLFTMLVEITHIIIENNIHYSLGGGTALGAAREKGFIKWDDDIDININIIDLKKMKNINWNKYGYTLIKVGTYFKLKKNNVNLNSKKIFIDVFILYNSKKFSKTRFKIGLILSILSLRWHILKIEGPSSNQSNYRFKKYFIVFFTFWLWLMPSCLWNKLKMWCFTTKKNTEFMSVAENAYWWKKSYAEKNLYNNYIKIEFEKKEFIIYSNFNKYLKNLYKDWKIPIKTHTHF